MFNRAAIAIIAVCLSLSGMANAQHTPWLYWTLLPQEQMDEIVGEASGETAWNTIMETGGYNKDRQAEEYASIFYETQYVSDQLKLYGLPGSEVVRFPGGEIWDGVKGELWEVTPMRQKLASYKDMTAMLAKGSNNADVIAELVWVGRGTQAELDAADVAGKIVVTEGSISGVHSSACMQMGAEGVLAISQSRNYFDPIQMPIPSIGGRGRGGAASAPAKFGFMIPVRDGQYLKKRLMGGEKITAHAQVEATTEAYDMQDVICHIPGADPNLESVIFSAHLFEGYTKQGANDNKSGSAGILEVARVLHTLIEEGRLPKPKRNIRFLWGPEFSGTGPWVKANKDLMDKTLCNINMDMVGEWLTLNDAYMCMMRTTYGNAHYINDVMENYYRYVGEGNRERIQNRSSAYKVPHRIVAPTGAEEPFHYSIETHYGASDHEVFNNVSVQVPGIMMIAWPDRWYHTSGDRVDKSDPTQMKRISVIAAAAAYTIANADDQMAMKIAGEVTSNASRRLGHQLAVALEALNGSTAEALEGNYRAARTYVEGCMLAEQDTVDSVLELAPDDTAVKAYVGKMNRNIERLGRVHLDTLEARMEVVAKSLDADTVRLRTSSVERQAGRIVPSQTAKVTENGYGGTSLPSSANRGVGDTSELVRLINGKHDALELKIMLDAQRIKFANGQATGQTDLQALIDYLNTLKEAGFIKL